MIFSFLDLPPSLISLLPRLSSFLFPPPFSSLYFLPRPLFWTFLLPPSSTFLLLCTSSFLDPSFFLNIPPFLTFLLPQHSSFLDLLSIPSSTFLLPRPSFLTFLLLKPTSSTFLLAQRSSFLGLPPCSTFLLHLPFSFLCLSPSSSFPLFQLSLSFTFSLSRAFLLPPSSTFLLLCPSSFLNPSLPVYMHSYLHTLLRLVTYLHTQNSTFLDLLS